MDKRYRITIFFQGRAVNVVYREESRADEFIEKLMDPRTKRINAFDKPGEVPMVINTEHFLYASKAILNEGEE